MDRTEKLLGKIIMEAHMAQQVPLPRSSSSFPNDEQPSSLGQLEPETEDEMDVRDFSERPTNDKRSSKPSRKSRAMLQKSKSPARLPRLHGDECCHCQHS